MLTKRLARWAAAVCLAMGMCLVGVPPAHAGTSGITYNGNGSAYAGFIDDAVYWCNSGWEMVYLEDTVADGLGVRAYVNGYFYYDYTGGASGGGGDHCYNFSEWNHVSLQACSRNAVNGTIRLSNWGATEGFYA
ncbi:hypothetical protein ACIBH1_10825 [Nonomuraea sp. NPDC050663]|uniref:hypothetical protein n=1 Tax=Nonomuraea sp. NPDC050663 TaxID=3364370 RepID=UPI00378C54A4